MGPWARAAFWIVVVGQLVFLLGFIGYKEADLRSGKEVVLQTAPVDPRSLFQGDYAILDYEIATVPSDMRDARIGNSVYVVLVKAGDVWESTEYSTSRSRVEGELYIEGRVDRPGHLDFGIGTFFVPEGTGRIIEEAEDVKVVVNLDPDGSAIIKEVLVDGRPFDPNSPREN